MAGLLDRPYPLEPSALSHAVKAFLFGAFVAAFLLVFRPFGLHGAPRLWSLAAAYGTTCTVTMLVLNVALPRLLRRWFQEARWTVARELGWTLLNLAAIGLANAFLSASLGLVPFSPATLGRFTVFTALIGLFPITLAVLATEARRARSYTDASAAINSGLRGVEPSAPAPDPAAALPPQGPSGLTLPTEGGAPLQLGDEDLLFARAADNYVEVFHLHDGAHRRTVIRSSLKAVSEALEPRGGRIMRCHKSHLVDLHKVLRVSGNAQGLRLHLMGVEEPIPVSRQLSGTVRERLAVRP